MLSTLTALLALTTMAPPPEDVRDATKLQSVPSGITCDEMDDCTALSADLDGDGDADVILLAMSTMGVGDRNTVASVHVKDGARYRDAQRIAELPGEFDSARVSKETAVGGFKVLCFGAGCYAFDGKGWTTAAWTKAAKAPKPK